ncbi:MAG TPA: hypothetical protein VH144_00920 [Candidatus Saccharimonadales bacterium]|jgi:hypothetical protein|nr:hypothetical protein [Candidatus Saccharimonadales bacterium]
MNSALDIAQSVIRIPQVIAVAQVALGIVLVILTIVLLTHISYSVGHQTLLYRKKQPVKHWNRRFYPVLTVLFLLIAGLLTWLQSYKSHL